MTSTQKRRPRRIAADEAHSWARNLRLGNSLAKLTLSMLTIYVNAEGACYVGIEQLSEDTELSPDTVRKRLAWLESIGAIARFPQWIDETGRRNGDGRGKRTTDEIRLLIDADAEEIEARAKGTLDPISSTDSAAFSPRSQQGLTGSQDELSPRLAPDQPSDSGEGQDSLNQEPELSSQSPSKKNDPPEPEVLIGSGGEQVKIGDAFERFEHNYPTPIDDVPICVTLLGALSDTEREDAIVGALGYRAFVFDEKRKAWNATKFLRQRKWPGYVQLGRQRMPKPKPPRYFIAKGSNAHAGLLVACAISGLSPPRLMHSTEFGCEGVFVDAKPNAALASLAALHGQSMKAGIIENTKRWHAWRERMGECAMRMPEAKRMRARGAEIRDELNRVLKVPTIYRGARFPSCWPPPKGTSTAEAA